MGEKQRDLEGSDAGRAEISRLRLVAMKPLCKALLASRYTSNGMFKMENVTEVG